MKNKLLVIFFSLNYFFMINTSMSSEIDVYKKIDLFGEVLEKVNEEYVDEIN